MVRSIVILPLASSGNIRVKHMTDPYSSTDRCVSRLLDVYAKHGSIIIATDYDDTLAPFRDQTDTYPRTHALMRRCKALGFKIILFTAGEPERYPTMIQYMTDLGFAPDSVNENPIPLNYGRVIDLNKVTDQLSRYRSKIEARLEPEAI